MIKMCSFFCLIFGMVLCIFMWYYSLKFFIFCFFNSRIFSMGWCIIFELFLLVWGYVWVVKIIYIFLVIDFWYCIIFFMFRIIICCLLFVDVRIVIIGSIYILISFYFFICIFFFLIVKNNIWVKILFIVWK